LLLALTTLGVALTDEPLHIDELRQVGYYSGDLDFIIDGAFSQTQPPLDYLIGAGVERVFGKRDVVWRLPAVGFAWLALLIIGSLLWRPRDGGWFLVSLLALTPPFLEFSAYARPYALPLFLMALLLWSFERWRSSSKIIYLISGGLAALALPLSRTTEPPVFLLLTLITLLSIRLVYGKARGRWVWLPALLSVVGIAVSIAVIPFVETESYRAEGVNGLATVMSRLWRDILPVYVDNAPLGVFGLVGGLAGVMLVAWRVLRMKVPSQWWFLPLCFTGIAFPVLFAALSLPNQPYFDRYTYFVAVALGLGLVMLLRLIRSPTSATIIGTLALLGSAPVAVSALTEVSRPDFREAAEVSRPLIEAGNLVIYEQVASIARYRPGAFPGAPLYIPRSLPLIGSNQAANGSLEVEPGRRPMILVLGLQSEVDGWTEVPLGGRFHMLVPEQSPAVWDPEQQAAALWSACQSFTPETGSYLCVTAVRILFEAGDTSTAARYAKMTMDRIDDEVVASRVGESLATVSPDFVP
jgi:hypothetical protein